MFKVDRNGPSIKAVISYDISERKKIGFISNLKVMKFSQLPQILSASTIEDFQKLVDPDAYYFKFLPTTGGAILHLNWITISPQNKLIVILQALEIDAPRYSGGKARIEIIKTLFDEIPLP